MNSRSAEEHLPAAEVVRTELITPEPAKALAALFDLPSDRVPSDTLPPLWHWIYLLERVRQDELGVDGHPVHGIPAPPGEGFQRMFAGGRVTTYAPLRVGEIATRTTRVISSVEKVGKSGPLTFVTARSSIEQRGTTSIVDEIDIVYRARGSAIARREKPSEADAESAAAVRSQAVLELSIDEVLLFRFSALTYNAHRIHYDLDYAKSEGYPDLVVHGPLQALLMAEVLRRHDVSLVGHVFDYRLVAPAFGAQRVTASANLADHKTPALVRDAGQRVTATATLRPVELASR